MRWCRRAVMMMRESWWAIKSKKHPDTKPGLWVGPILHPSPIYDMLEQVKGLVLQNQRHSICMTEYNVQEESQWGISRKQRPRIRPKTPCSTHLQVKKYGHQDILCDLLCHTETTTVRIFLFYSKFYFICFVWKLQGQKSIAKGQEDKRGSDAWCEIHKESILMF